MAASFASTTSTYASSSSSYCAPAPPPLAEAIDADSDLVRRAASSTSSLRSRRNKLELGLELNLLPIVLEATQQQPVRSLAELEALYARLKAQQSVVAFEDDFALAKLDDSASTSSSCHLVPSEQTGNRSRYVDVRAVSATRVKLINSRESNDFIHANYVTLPTRRQDERVIVTQSPMEHTAEHFWEMCWNERVPLVVMLNQFDEPGKPVAFQYLPLSSNGSVLQFGRFTVRCVQDDNGVGAAWRQRTLVLECASSSSITITHLQCTAWDDFAAIDDDDDPQAVQGLRRAVGLMRAQLVNNSKNDGMSVVHCSAGAGRSGVLVSIVALLELAAHGQWMPPCQLVGELRRQRAGLVQTARQYRMIFDVVMPMLRREHGGGSSVEEEEEKEA